MSGDTAPIFQTVCWDSQIIVVFAFAFDVCIGSRNIKNSHNFWTCTTSPFSLWVMFGDAAEEVIKWSLCVWYVAEWFLILHVYLPGPQLIAGVVLGMDACLSLVWHVVWICILSYNHSLIFQLQRLAPSITDFTHFDQINSLNSPHLLFWTQLNMYPGIQQPLWTFNISIFIKKESLDDVFLARIPQCMCHCSAMSNSEGDD